MSIVSLVSGGLDSTLMAKLTDEEGIHQTPLFIDYGQIARDRELKACEEAMESLGLPRPKIANLAGYGKLIQSGLTSDSLHIVDEAFTPGRNMLFILVAASCAYQASADAISIGLLNEDTSLFPDQTTQFIRSAQGMIEICMGKKITILTPLSEFHKVDIIELAKARGISNTYSCHTGLNTPCGTCIACSEFNI